MITRVSPRLGLAVILACSACTTGCAPDLAETQTVTPEPPRLSRAQVYDRDRSLVAGLATSLALGIVGLGTVLASGIWAAPGVGEPHAPPRAIMIAGGIMSAGFITTIPFAIGVERHRARYPQYFPHQRSRVHPAPPRSASAPTAPLPSLSLRPRPSL